jgi:hypothetical protein
MAMTKALLQKFVKKKKENLKQPFFNLGNEDRDEFMKVCQEVKISIAKYLQ